MFNEGHKDTKMCLHLWYRHKQVLLTYGTHTEKIFTFRDTDTKKVIT